MSHPLLELRRLIAPQSVPMTGSVVSVAGVITVSSPLGVSTVSSAIPVKVGDRVLVIGNVIQGKVQAQEELPQYYL